MLTVTSGLVQTPVVAAGPPSVRSPVQTVTASQYCARMPAPFAGEIGATLPQSREAWPEPPRAPAGAPNVLIWLIDDAGFGLMSAFGGLVATPNLDKLAGSGLRYTNFHSTPLCSSSRAALLTGRNAHSAHMGSHGGTSMGYPGYDGFVPPSVASGAEMLRQQGYGTIALGKWDQAPMRHLNPTGPFELWPTGQGFDRYYGFMWHGSDHFRPTLVQDNTILERPPERKDYFLTTDLADRAISYINGIQAMRPNTPFYMYWASGAVHSPHHATKPWLDRYQGRFDMGWDEYRRQVLARQIGMGLVPKDTKLAPMQAELPRWDTLSSQAKRLYARQMEAIAAQMSQTDHEFGRMIDALKANGQFENTIILVTSDNGASAEGGPDGSYMEAGLTAGVTSLTKNLQYLEDWGGASTMPNYSSAWGVAASTPFRYYKQTAHEGGHRVPMILSWPKGIKSPGQRNQYGHLIDIVPTILEAAGIEPPSCVNGVPQKPFDGISLLYSFNDPAAPERRKTQYYEMWGNRGIYSDGWKAVVLHKRRAWEMQKSIPFDEDVWELYNVRKDPGETEDLSKRHPQKLAELRTLFDQEAKKFNVYPLADFGSRIAARSGQGYVADSLRAVYDFPQPGVTAVSESALPLARGHSYTLTARFDATSSDQGVIAAAGGVEGGFSLYLKDGKIRYDNVEFGVKNLTLVDDQPVTDGQTSVELRWIQNDGNSVNVIMVVNGREAAKGQMHTHVQGMHSSNELFNVGKDTGAPATDSYEGSFPFTGHIRNVRITVPE